jgi:hypothetical protein
LHHQLFAIIWRIFAANQFKLPLDQHTKVRKSVNKRDKRGAEETMQHRKRTQRGDLKSTKFTRNFR